MDALMLHRTDPADLAVMPVMDMATAGERYNSMVAFVKGLMHEGSDFGVIPGTNGKPVLLKPGAEKLCTFFGLSKRFVLAQSIEDWDGSDRGGEPMFYYLYRCQLWRSDLLVAESDGSCNSRESKYRWRKGERTCPRCNQPAIIKGKAEYGGGWLCFARRGGCGAKFNDGDATIEGQDVGRIPNPDVADQVNTIQKMAQKRALIAATLLAVNASEFFTQDMEDFVDAEVVSRPAEPTRQISNGSGRPPAQAGTSNGQRLVPTTGTGDTNDPGWWVKRYSDCTSMDDVHAVDEELAKAPVRIGKKPEVNNARQLALDELAKAATDFGGAFGATVAKSEAVPA